MMSKFEKINEKEEPPHTSYKFYSYILHRITGEKIV